MPTWSTLTTGLSRRGLMCGASLEMPGGCHLDCEGYLQIPLS